MQPATPSAVHTVADDAVPPGEDEWVRHCRVVFAFYFTFLDFCFQKREIKRKKLKKGHQELQIAANLCQLNSEYLKSAPTSTVRLMVSDIFKGGAMEIEHADLLLYKRWIASLTAVRRKHKRFGKPSELCSRVAPRQKFIPIASDRARQSQIRYCCKATIGNRLVGSEKIKNQILPRMYSIVHPKIPFRFASKFAPKIDSCTSFHENFVSHLAAYPNSFLA